MSRIAPIGNRDTIAEGLTDLSQDKQHWLTLVMEKPESDDLLLDGLHLFLHQASESRFLNTLKLVKCGEWLGNSAPGRLQVRLMEAAKSSQHPAYQAFREGLVRSGGLERAYPKSDL
jgi:hypothetical protein